jgi:hypothetical protein
MSPRLRWTSALACLAAALVLLPLALGAPRLTLLNAALRVDFAWMVVAAAGAMTALLASATAMAPRRLARVALGCLTVAAVLFGAARLRYRLEVQPDGLHARELTGATAVAWSEVTHVDRGTEAIVVWGQGDAQIRVDTARFEGDQRAALERALARRIVESTTASK